MRYAVIENDIVVNIIEAEERGAESLSEFMELVNTGDKPVAIGDTYRDDSFFRDEQEVLTTEAEEINALREEINALKAQLKEKEGL